ncbi:hypothetical protein GCM10009702_09550 [Propioniferax innocua]|uniref:FAD-dependent oxidoreductase n=1 Tax=Propioniferax innocua TaxID=1753 RepID=UPI001B88648D|nr:FAD-dependent oxidoreductase [Propioniferax innocua]
MAQDNRNQLSTYQSGWPWARERFGRFEIGHEAEGGPITDELRAIWNKMPDEAERAADIVVVGGGLSGVAAAVASARRGLQVVLVEETHMVGGQATAAGVSSFDVTTFYDRMINDHGIWGEYVSRLLDLYEGELSRPLNVTHYRDDSIGPNVSGAERVLTEMLRESGVVTLRNTQVTGVIRNGATVGGVKTQAGPITAKVTIDATETGELLSLGGVPHRIGRLESDGLMTWPRAVAFAPIQDITRTLVVREYPDGVPDELVLKEPPRGYGRTSLSFARAMPKLGVPLVDPMLRLGPLGFAAYRAAPDLSRRQVHTGAEWQRVTRTCLNYMNDFPVTTAYLTSPEERQEADAMAFEKTLCVLFYMQQELGLNWSVATDEGFADGPRSFNPHIDEKYREFERHSPLIPYIRESRRVIGAGTLVGKEIWRDRNHGEAPWHKDTIAVGTYPPDLHGGRQAGDLEKETLGETLEDKPKSWREGPFSIPMHSLIPKWVDGFLVAEKNISVSRIASGAIRLHPTVTAIGEAAGVLAAIAVKTNRSSREVLPVEVQLELANGGALITQLAVASIGRDSEDFAPVTLALARERVDSQIRRPANAEPEIEVDIECARDVGGKMSAYLHSRWENFGWKRKG